MAQARNLRNVPTHTHFCPCFAAVDLTSFRRLECSSAGSIFQTQRLSPVLLPSSPPSCSPPPPCPTSSNVCAGVSKHKSVKLSKLGKGQPSNSLLCIAGEHHVTPHSSVGVTQKPILVRGTTRNYKQYFDLPSSPRLGRSKAELSMVVPAPGKKLQVPGDHEAMLQAQADR